MDVSCFFDFHELINGLLYNITIINRVSVKGKTLEH